MKNELKNNALPSKAIFRAYDIRGVVGETLTPEVVHTLGLAIGSEARERGQQTVTIARDGRLSGPQLLPALAAGLLATGCDVINVGEVPTPVLYFSTYHLKTRTGVMLTGSHNPVNYNGIKLMIDDETLAGDRITALYDRIVEQNFVTGQGTLREEPVDEAYLDRIVGDIKLTRPLKVVVDCGNGVAGHLMPRLMEKLGCDVESIHCEIDGNFPNHHPDPSVPENLQDLIKKVREVHADIGFALDGDGDRLGVVTNRGDIIWPDRQMMLYAKDVLGRYPGAEIIFDVKCSQHLASVISEHGGKPIMWRTGHSHLKKRLFASDSPLAGEMSGHIFFKERWYGFDDGLYTAARLLEILSHDGRSSHELFLDIPDSINTPELKIAIDEEKKFTFMETFVANATFEDARVVTIDGVRADFSNGWGLVRASNTTAYLTARFEATTEDALKEIQQQFREQLLAIDASLDLPF